MGRATTPTELSLLLPRIARADGVLRATSPAVQKATAVFHITRAEICLLAGEPVLPHLKAAREALRNFPATPAPRSAECCAGPERGPSIAEKCITCPYLDEAYKPCPACGSEERGQGGYLSCECPAVSIPSGVPGGEVKR